MEEDIKCLNSWGDWRGSEPWLRNTAYELNRQYRELRKDIRENTNTWSYSKFCERLAYHSFNLACYYNDELFNKYKIGLESIKIFLENCLEKLNEVSYKENYSENTMKLRNDAQTFLKEITNIYAQQKIVKTQCSASNVKKYIKLCIVVGSINQIPSQQCSNEEKRLIQNILLIRLINTLENRITVRKHKNTFLIAKQSDYLSQAYRLAEQFKLSRRYKNSTENLTKIISTYKGPEFNIDKRTEINDIIRKEIDVYKSNLEQVKSYIEEKFHQSLSNTDKTYVEREYLKYCTRFWLQETTNLLNELITTKNSFVILDIFYSLDVVKSLSQIPNPLNQLKSYALLMEHYEFVTEENERNFIDDFKKECFNQILTYSDSAKNELEFLESFINFLSSSKNLQSIIFEIGLEDFCRDTLSFGNLINNIMTLDVTTYGESLNALQEVTKGLKEEDLFLTDKLKEILIDYTKPVKMQKCNVDGRLVVEVLGKNIVVSNILKQLENEFLGKFRIEEVRFIADDVIHIDADFKIEIWHGKNVVVLTKMVKIYNEVVWDVSGENNNYIYSGNAGTDKNGHGKQGKDGYPGESGGNVKILTMNIENSENFTIISNGGNGSKGQDGGNGRDGEDGIGIKKVDFDNKFPSPVKFANDPDCRWESVSKLFENIKKESSTIECQIKERNSPNNVFIEARTDKGNEVIFSYCGGGFSVRFQSFMLYKGSLGQAGGRGGEFGLGGQGGYAGEVIVKKGNQEFLITKSTKPAEEGKKGQGGIYGRHGKNGWDMGFLDYQTWKDVKFRGRDETSKCTLEYYNNDNNPSDRVWCEYKNKYAAITSVNIEHKKGKKHEERMKTRHNNDRQHHAQAVRKKNISENAILAKYSHHLSAIERHTLRNIQSELESINRRAMQTISENQEQQEKQTTEISVKRNSHYQNINTSNNDLYISTISETLKKYTINATTLIDKLTKEPSCTDTWILLSQIELNFTQLKNVFLILTGNTNDNKLHYIESILIDKYRLAVLQEITQQLPSHEELKDYVKLSPENAARYLIESKASENNISHPVLGTLNQYLFEMNDQHQESVLKYCKEESQSDNEHFQSLKRSLIHFVFEVRELEKVPLSIKKYYSEYKTFVKNHIDSLKIYLEAFKKEIYQPRNEKILRLWLESIQNKCKKWELEEELKKDIFLHALYNRLNTQLKQEYDWNNCCKDADVLYEHCNYIRTNGILSGTYRELLANIFSINIRLYSEDQDRTLHLQSDHNSSSKRNIHILLRDNTLSQLDIDKSYLSLAERRKKKNNVCAKILAEINQLKQKKQFDDYLENKTFLSESKPPLNKYFFDEEKDIENIINYFPEEERQQLKVRLDKITSQYIGQHRILHSMMKRFSSGGRYVSSQELYFLISTILNSVNEDKNELNIFAWIVAAYPQNRWIDELILIHIENYFRQALPEKHKWRQYLSQIENKEILLLFEMKLNQQKLGSPISIQCVEDIFRLFSHITNDTISLEGLELAEWPYVLKEKYWTCKLSKLVDWELDDLAAATYYLMSIESIFGGHLTETFMDAIAKKTHQLSPQTLTMILSNFHHEKWCLCEDALNDLNTCTVDEWRQNLQDKFIDNKEERNITQLVELIKYKATTSKEILKNLPKIKSYIESIKKYKIDEKPTNSFTENDIKKWVETWKQNKRRPGFEEKYEEIFAVIDRALELKRGFKLRDTQKLTVLTLLMNHRNTLAQVSTGEGKSLIVVAASIIKAICGMKVDIITSSSVLARRDAEDNRDIYKLFDINVSHNCNEDIEKRKEAYSGNQVVYGDLSSFQRDYLLDKFYGKNILGNRDFENVIVDEVDSMLLDKGNNMLYLSHDLAGLDKLESVYLFIWQWINRPTSNFDEVQHVFDIEAIKEAVISDLYGLVKKEDIGTIGFELSKFQINVIWEGLVETKLVDGYGKLLVESISENDLNKIFSGELVTYKNRFRFLLKERFERLKYIHVPNALRPFIEQHLESWIKSAVAAYFMREGENYVVDVDKTGTSPDKNPNIIILDTDTGTDQANSQWDEALHQFLQLKHGCKLSLQSLKAVFISNVSFFKLYRYLYGLTGTLGSEIERDLLQEMHGVDFVIIPTAKSKQFYEITPILCSGETDWVNCICSEVKKLMEVQKRSVLIICETVNEVEVLHKAFGGNNVKHVHTYTRDYEEFERGFKMINHNKELQQGQVIIATNLAGRGTDIKITQELREANGLHVCLTFLPNNVRVENQAFGRAARCGDQGSGQLIIFNSKGQGYSNAKVLDLKQQRNSEERHRVSKIKAHYLIQITMEENLFKLFKEQYEELKNQLDKEKVPSEVKAILLQSCLDKWAFWLDEHSQYLRELIDEQGKVSLYNRLDKFITVLKTLGTGYSEMVDENQIVIEHDTTSWLDWVEGSSNQMIKLGKYLCQNGLLKNSQQNAFKLFNAVIKTEPHFSEAAHYYKAYALAKKINWEKITEGENRENLQEFKKELRKTEKLLEAHSRFAMQAAGIIGKIKKNNTKSIIQIDAYEEQQTSLSKLYHMFSQSIADIFGHSVTPQSFVNSYVGKELAEVLYADLLRQGVLKKPTVKDDVSEEDLQLISYGHGISLKALKSVFSKYEGRDINEKQFQKELKEKVQMPSREVFWKLLVQRKFLNEEVKYVVVDDGKFNEIDPSLRDFLAERTSHKDIEKQTFDQINEWIYYNPESVERQKNSSNIFKKGDFIKIVGRVMYEVLKERGVLSFNKKAHVDIGKYESMIFPCYDSITVEDFAKVNIIRSDAEQILIKLAEQDVLERWNDSKENIYRLKIRYEEINDVRLSFCPVYEGAVKGLLHACFSYRIALQKIKKHIEAKEPVESLQLTMKPHHNLILELLEQKIISLTMVVDDPENKLKPMYNQVMTKDEFKRMLAEDKRISKECTEELFDCLFEKKWVVLYDPIQYVQDKGVDAISIENAKNMCKSAVEDFYCIIKSEKRQLPLNFHHGKLQGIDKTVGKILDDRLNLSNDNSIKTVMSALKRSRGLLEALKVPAPNLKSLTDLLGEGNFSSMEEVHIFFLNGLDQLIQFEEKKWTSEMLVNTAIVVCMGVVQITAGALIELYSAGVMTHVGAGLINEGVSDIFFAMGALMSGHFSWGDYWEHKLVSLAMTTVTVGVGAYWSRCAKVSRYGHKIAGPNFEVGTKVAKMTGNKLIQEAGLKRVGQEVLKRVLLKTVEGIAIGLVNSGVDTIVQNYLRELCDGLCTKILSDIDTKIETHKISMNLRNVYQTLGTEKAKQLIDDVTKSVFSRQTYVEQFAGIASKLVGAISKGIEEASKKRNKTSNKMGLPIDVISKVIVWSEHAVHIANIALITNEFLNKLDTEITNELSKIKKNERDENKGKDEEYASFKKEIIDGWKSLLHEKAGHILSQHLLSPILKDGANRLVRHVGKKIQETYQSCKESAYCEFFEDLKEEYNQNLQKAKKSRNSSRIKKHIKEKYQKDLIKLMAKTRNPKLFAAIVRENVPMDMTCVNACTIVLHKMLQDQGIERFSIVVEGEGGIRQKFSSGPDGAPGLTIQLQVKDNHFSLAGSNDSQTNRNSKNNCLFEAISEAVSLKMTPKEFRAKIANCIEHDSKIQYDIKQGWHEFAIYKDAIGGQRAYDEKISGAELNKRIKNKTIQFSQSSIGVKTRDGLHIDQLSENMKKDGWKGDPIKAVKYKDNTLVVLDHRRTLAMANTQSPDIEAHLAIYEQEDEFSSETCEKQYGTRKAGEAVTKRMRRGSLPDYDGIGFPSTYVRLRTGQNGETELNPTTLRQMRELNLIIGSRKRSKSVGDGTK